MEDDFIVTESETPFSSQRKFLLAIIMLLATLILSSLCAITFLVTEPIEDVGFSQAQSTSTPPSTPDMRGTATSPSPSSAAEIEIEITPAAPTDTVETREGALRIIEYGGAHRIIEYEGSGSQIRSNLTSTPHKPHQIVKYDMRIIRYDIPPTEESGDRTNETTDDSE